jgi:hypothetical protein
MDSNIELNLGKWYTGKALVNATEALASLNRSMELGYWESRASVKVPAALAKSNVAIKAAKPFVHGMGNPDESLAARVLYFGQFLVAQAHSFCGEGLNRLAAEYAADFREVAEAVEYLNAESKANKALAESKDGNPIGICACCFRAQKVQPSGTMYAHGYRRPGWGFVVGGCPGADFPPYAVTR